MSGVLKVNQVLLGSNADQTKNFKITVPTPEDGTLTIERGDGTDVMKFLANGGVEMPTLPFSKSNNGYMTLPNGLIVQWGNTITNASGVATVTFPIPFPTACLQTIATSATPIRIMTVAGPLSPSFADFYSHNDSGVGAAADFRWLAIGY